MRSAKLRKKGLPEEISAEIRRVCAEVDRMRAEPQAAKPFANQNDIARIFRECSRVPTAGKGARC